MRVPTVTHPNTQRPHAEDPEGDHGIVPPWLQRVRPGQEPDDVVEVAEGYRLPLPYPPR